jgi:hypothetical protein
MHSRQPLKPADQARRIVELWQERPRRQRTAEEVLTFYGWLTDHEPALIPRGPGSYQQVQVILGPHIRETKD